MLPFGESNFCSVVVRQDEEQQNGKIESCGRLRKCALKYNG
jgi:hypothetical protein